MCVDEIMCQWKRSRTSKWHVLELDANIDGVLRRVQDADFLQRLHVLQQLRLVCIDGVVCQRKLVWTFQQHLLELGGARSFVPR